MEYADWEGRYIAVTDDLHYSREGDAKAAERLAVLAYLRHGRVAGDHELSQLLARQPVYVCAGGPTLEEELGDHRLDATVVATDGAVGRLLKRGTIPEIIVTDLDGDLDSILSANRKGSIAVVHAHADNLPKLEEFLPKFEGAIVPSVQCLPPARTRNFGGLTDGDRAVFLADHFGASRIVLAGFDFGDEEKHPLSKERQRKFLWGALLIASLDNPAVMFFDEYRKAQDPSSPGDGEFGKGLARQP